MKIKIQNRALGKLPALLMGAGLTLFFVTMAVGLALSYTEGPNSEAVSIQDHNSTHDKLFWNTSYEENDILEKVLVVNTRTGETSKLLAPGSSTIISNSEKYRVFIMNTGYYGSEDRELIGSIENGTVSEPPTN